MVRKNKDFAPLLLVANEKTRNYLVHLLEENNYAPIVMSDPGELLQALKGCRYATVFLDCEAIPIYGPGIYSKIKVAGHSCRVVLLCDKEHKDHRDIIKEAMEIGVYACLLAPFQGWEVLTMVRYSQAKKQPKKRPAKKKLLK